MFQDDIIVPVRKALQYYTDMQQALQEEVSRKEKQEQSMRRENPSSLLKTPSAVDSLPSTQQLKNKDRLTSHRDGKMK